MKKQITWAIFDLLFFSACGSSSTSLDSLHIKNESLPDWAVVEVIKAVNKAADCEILKEYSDGLPLVTSNFDIKRERDRTHDSTEAMVMMFERLIMPEYRPGDFDSGDIFIDQPVFYIEVLMHEIGHALWLDHKDNTIMGPSMVFDHPPYANFNDAARSLVDELKRQKSPFYSGCLRAKNQPKE